MANRISVCIILIPCIIFSISGKAYAETSAVISEVMANPENGSDDEYLEILNTGTEPIDLASCWIASANGNKQKLMPYTGMHRHGGSGTLLAPSGVALITSPRYGGAYANFIQRNALSVGSLIHITIDGTRFLSYGLGNNAGIVLLLDDAGRTLNAFSWTSDAGRNVSWERENPFLKSSVVVQRFGGTPGIVTQYLASSDFRDERARLAKRILRRGEQGRVILTLRPGEYARIALRHRDGREIAVIQNRLEGAGRHEVPVALVLPTGGALMSGSYILDLRVTTAQGRSRHETLLLQIAPGMR
ncbi:MAG: lamin tail domain-containing protein [Spirochaetota bacterium]|jgi:hypothetical protein|nr:lamin tail domain-containing protein [Spirochaetota bacterium]